MRDPAILLERRLNSVNSRAGWTALLRRFNTLKLENGGDPRLYITRLLEYKNALSSTDQAISDKFFIAHLLTSLPPAFDSIIDIITYMGPEVQTLDYVITTLTEWWQFRQNRNEKYFSETNAAGTMSTGNAAPTAGCTRPWKSNRPRKKSSRWKKEHHGGQQNGVERAAGSKRPRCWYCKKEGHKQADCFSRKKAGGQFMGTVPGQL